MDADDRLGRLHHPCSVSYNYRTDVKTLYCSNGNILQNRRKLLLPSIEFEVLDGDTVLLVSSQPHERDDAATAARIEQLAQCGWVEGILFHTNDDSGHECRFTHPRFNPRNSTKPFKHSRRLAPL